MGFNRAGMEGPGVCVAVSGPLAPLVDDLREGLACRGYTPRSVRDHLYVVSWLSGWLEARGLAADDLTAAVVEEFFRLRKAQGRLKWLTWRSASVLLGCLGIEWPVDGLAAATPCEALVVSYRDYLLAERGLAAGTAAQYLRRARVFLSWLPTPIEAGLAGLSAEQVTTFIMVWCPGHGAADAKMMVTALRSLLRFLYVTGRVSVPLVDAVPSVPGWRRLRLPQVVGADQVARLLAGCDRSGPSGLRDFAVIVLMARLGLRAGEVGVLRLSDVDWQAGLMTVRGKGNRLDVLPLPVDVGEAMADYLQHGRPRTPARPHLFVCAIAPFGPLHTNTVISIVHRACRRAGIPSFGPHRLRHAVACDLLAEGASLEEIGQLLRHSEEATTSQYAKVDLVRLGGLVLPCPIGAVR
jgi:site-specific recombinase XerD